MQKYIESWFKAAAGVIHDRAWFFILITGVMAVGLGLQISRLNIDTSNESYFHKSDPVLTAYNDFKAQFGTDELIVVAIEAPDIFRRSFLRRLEKLHKDLAENVPHLADITSLVNARNTRGEVDRLIVEDLLEHFPESDTELEALKERVMTHPLYRNRLISKDGTMTAIIIETDLADTQAPADVLSGFDDEVSGADTVAKNRGRTKNEIAETVVTCVQGITENFDADGFRIHLAGSPVVMKVHKTAMMRDMGRFLLLAILTIGICLYLMFRRLSGVLLPFLVVILSLFSTLGLMGLCGVSFTQPNMILPSFLLAVGVGASVHILALVFRRLGQGEDKRSAIVYAMGHSGFAVVITSLTTAVGLASFATTALAPIASLGIFGGAGVLLSLFYTILMIPALLAILPLKQPTGKSTPARSYDRFDGIMDWVMEIALRRPKMITIMTFLFLAAGLAGALQLQFSHDTLEWLPSSWDCRRATETIDRVMGGVLNIEVLVDTGVENGLYDPEVLKHLDRLAGELETFDNGRVRVAKASSITDVLKEIHQALNENRPEFYTVPDNPDLIPQEFLLFENSGSDDLEKVTDASFRLARFTVQVPWLDAFYYVPLLQKIKTDFQAVFGHRATVATTGLLQIFVHTVEAAARSMAQGYIIAAVLITLMMILMVGGLRMGIISMIPNLAPVVLAMGLMYLLRFPLDVYTMMIGTIALGLAVDDTVHFMNGFRHYFNDGDDAREAIRKTLRTSGRAMLITTVVLAVGFFMFTFASMRNVIRFGGLTGFTLLLALAADFFSLPALIMLMHLSPRSVSQPIRISEGQKGVLP